MTPVLSTRTQEVEDTAARCYHVSKRLWYDAVRAKLLTWRQYYIDNAAAITTPGTPERTEELRLHNVFTAAIYNDFMTWLRPVPYSNPQKFASLGGSWDGKRCNGSASICQSVFVPGGYLMEDPDPDSSHVTPIYALPQPGGGTWQPSSDPHCYSDAALVQTLADLQRDAYLATGQFMQHFNASGPAGTVATVTDQEIAVWQVSIQAIFDMYVTLWVHTLCGVVVPPTQLHPTSPHPVPLYPPDPNSLV